MVIFNFNFNIYFKNDKKNKRQLIRYDDPHIPLTYTDRNRLEGKPKPTIATSGRWLAVRVKFTLTSSTYATMCIREMTKQDSSVGYQCILAAQSHSESSTPK